MEPNMMQTGQYEPGVGMVNPQWQGGEGQGSGYGQFLSQLMEQNPDNSRVQEMALMEMMEQKKGQDNLPMLELMLASGDPELTELAKVQMMGMYGGDSGYGAGDDYGTYQKQMINESLQQPNLGREEFERLTYERDLPDYLRAEYDRAPGYGERLGHVKDQLSTNPMAALGALTGFSWLANPATAPAALMLPFLTKAKDIQKERMKQYGY